MLAPPMLQLRAPKPTLRSAKVHNRPRKPRKRKRKPTLPNVKTHKRWRKPMQPSGQARKH
jgi:hypothetical protein